MAFTGFVRGQGPIVSLNAATSGNGGTVDFGQPVNNISFSIVGSAGITAGAVTLQLSADGVNWAVPPAGAFTDNSAATAANPYTVTASSVALFTTIGAAVRYARVNVSTTITGGTVSASISGV